MCLDLIATGPTDGPGPVEYELIDLEATAQEALTLFKRFEVVLIKQECEQESFSARR